MRCEYGRLFFPWLLRNALCQSALIGLKYGSALLRKSGQTHLDDATPKTVPMKVKTGLKGRPLTKLAPQAKVDTLCYHPKMNHNSTLIFLMRLPCSENGLPCIVPHDTSIHALVYVRG